MIKKSIFLTLFLYTLNVHAALVDSFSIGAGAGDPNSLRGGRVALQKDWHVNWLNFLGWHVTGYWDANLAYWRTNGNQFGQYKDITTLGFNPVFRWIRNEPLFSSVTPYLEASVGIAGLSKRRLGHRQLGANWAFEDLLGFGARFGCRQQYDLSLHYLHFSNADIKKPNNGIDVKFLVMFRYYFNP